jgi:hypothetical protein
MKKHVVFFASDINSEEEPNPNVLWAANFNLSEEYKFSLPTNLLQAVTQDYKTISYPLVWWQNEFQKLSFELDIDYAYAKEYTWHWQDVEALRVTIKANDINSCSNQIIIPRKIAKIILTEMKLGLSGSMHPEKFYGKLITVIDLSEIILDEDVILSALLQLEEICESCVQYESNIEWRLE